MLFAQQLILDTVILQIMLKYSATKCICVRTLPHYNFFEKLRPTDRAAPEFVR